jgi:cardiolipin synthase
VQYRTRHLGMKYVEGSRQMRKMLRVKRIGAVLGILLVVVLSLIGILSITRGTPVRAVVAIGDHEGPPAVGDSLFTESIELYTGLHLTGGNAARLSLNVDGLYPQVWLDLRAARHTITVQMYYSHPGAVADTFAAIMKERARAGVRVLLVLDAFGSQNLKKEWADSLRAAHVELALLRQLHWYSLHNASDRSHVRVVVVDGEIAWTGGFGLADYWLGDGRHKDQWRETNVRFEGPSVMGLQAAFAAAWAECTGELISGDVFFPKKAFTQMDGGLNAGVFFSSPTTGSTPAERFIALSIAGARKTLYVSNSYFVPDDDFRKLLKQARARGVDVRILTVSKETDVKTTWWAGRSRYEELLRAGVRIYEYQPTMMHSKTFIVDGRWGAIGSMNFDNRSLAFNNESNFVFLDAPLGAQMDSIFLDDLTRSQEIRLETFQRRPWYDRVIEYGAAVFSRLL